MVISHKAQLLLLEISKLGFVKFKDQSTYTNQVAFRRIIKKLLGTNWIRSRPFDSNEYYLTVVGEIVVRSIKKFCES